MLKFRIWKSEIAMRLAACAAIALATSATSANAHRAHHTNGGATPVLRKITPDSMLFEIDAATATVSRSGYPKIMIVSGRHFTRRSQVCANGAPVRTRFRSSSTLLVNIAEIESHLITDKDNDRRRYADITVRASGHNSRTTGSIRFTQFTEGNAGG